MKKVMIICALMISAVTFTKAQGGGQFNPNATPEERAKTSLESQRFATLALTADQKTKATPILIAYYKASAELNAKAAAAADPQAVRTENRPKLTALGEENEKAVLAAIALTADQKKAYDALLAASKERNPNATTVIVSSGFGGGGRGQGGQGGGGGAQGGAPRPAGQ